MRATVHDTINAISALEWDGVVGPERLFQSHAWLRILEGGAISGCAPKYVVVRDGEGAILATVAAYIIPTSLVMFSSGVIKWAVDGIRRYLPWFLRPRILECGSPLGPGNGISIRPGITMADVAPIVCETLDRIAADERLPLIVLRDFAQEELDTSAAFEPAGYIRSDSLPTMSLDIRWSSYTDYLGAMTSRHRQKVRRGLSLAKNAGLRVRWTDRIGDKAVQLARQRENVRQRATEYSREQLTPEFFAQLDSGFGPKARVLEVMNGADRVGHALVVEDGNVLRWLSFGRETSGTRDGAYFLVIASLVKRAIEDGKLRLDMGMTTHGPKTDFGAALIPQWMLLRFRGPLGKLLPLALNYLTPHRETLARRVFKQDKA